MTLSPTLVVVLAACAIGTAAMFWSIRRKVRRHTAGRAPLDETEFAALFPGKESAARHVRRALEPVIPGDVRLVLPADAIAADLMVGTVDGLDANQVVLDIEKSCGIKIPDKDAESVYTVAELVDLTHRIMSEQSNQPLHPTLRASAQRG